MYSILFTYIWAVYGVNDGKYSSTMEHMGLRLVGGQPWNFMTFPFSWECLHSNWRTHSIIFQRGWFVETTNQLTSCTLNFLWRFFFTLCLFTHFFAHEKNIRSTCWTIHVLRSSERQVMVWLWTWCAIPFQAGAGSSSPLMVMKCYECAYYIWKKTINIHKWGSDMFYMWISVTYIYIYIYI